MEKYEIAFELGEYTVLRKGGKLYLAHKSVKEPVELAPHLLKALFKSVMREAVGL